MNTRVNEVGQELSAFDAPELSDGDVAEHYANMVRNAIDRSKLGEVVEAKAAVGQMHFLCRVKEDKKKDWINRFEYNVLLLMKGTGNDVFVGNERFLNKNDELRFGYVISVGSKDVKDAAQKLCEAIDRAVPRMEVLEAPLLGPGTPVGAGPKGGKKGAAPIRTK